MPVSVPVRAPARLYARRPASAVVIHIDPIAVTVEIIQSRYIVIDIAVTGRAGVRVIIERVIQIAIVGAVSPVIQIRVAVAVIIIDYASRKIGRKLRQQDRGGGLGRERQYLSSADFACPGKPHYLRKPAQHRDPAITVIAVSYLIEAGLYKIDCAVRSSNLKQLSIPEIAEVEES
jgi:hypothetical protein